MKTPKRRGPHSLQSDRVEVSEDTHRKEQTPHRGAQQRRSVPGSEGTVYITREDTYRVPSPSAEHPFMSVNKRDNPESVGSRQRKSQKQPDPQHIPPTNRESLTASQERKRRGRQEIKNNLYQS